MMMNSVRYNGRMTRQRGPDEIPAARAVGVIGLGVMGRPMALNLLRGLPAGSTVHVTARDPRSAAPVLAGGAQWHESARDVAAAADVVILMVPDLLDARAVLAGPAGLLAGVRRPTVLAISSTVSPDGVRVLAQEVREATDGLLSVVDAPVSGGEEGAVDGTLSVMVGGAPEDVERVLDIYQVVGTPVHLGPLGAGQVAKACNQIIVAAEVLALGEAAVIAERAGLDVLQMFDLLQRGYAGSRVLEVKKRRFAEHDHSPSGAARFMVKDLGFATDEARRSGTPTPQTDVLLRVFTDLTERGYGDQDTAVVQAYLETYERRGTGVRHLVVMGVSGSGKTTVGERLAGRLGVPFAEGDAFHTEGSRAKMAAGIPLTDADRWPWLASLRDWMSTNAARGTGSVVACSALRRPYRDILREADGQVVLVHLLAEPAVLSVRMDQRVDHYMPPSLLASQLGTLEPLEPDEPGLVIDVERDVDLVVATVLRRLEGAA